MRKMPTVLDRWNAFKRLLLIIFSILMWVMSIAFSYMGFKSGVRTEWYFGVFAVILSGTITTMELYLNSQTFDLTEFNVGIIVLWIGGIAAYAYGVWTNIIGVSIMMIGTGDLTTVSLERQFVPIIVGLLLEVLPEPMFVAFLTARMETRVPADLERTQMTQSQFKRHDHDNRDNRDNRDPHKVGELIRTLRDNHPINRH